MSSGSHQPLQWWNYTSLNDVDLNTFYQRYLDMFKGTTDAPREFIFTALLSSLGAAISTSRWIVWGSKKMYPNIWTMLVGCSTLVRKTTSINTGLYFNILYDSEHPERYYKLPEDGSLAALLSVLAHEKHGVLKHSEVATLLNIMSKGYNISMKALFTDFFDVPKSHKIKLKGEGDIFVEEPIFSMATATTPLWLKKNLAYGDWESGFPARFLYCFRNHKDETIPIPIAPDNTIVSELKELYGALYTKKPREITLDESYQEAYKHYYAEVDALYRDPLLDDASKSLIGRLQSDYFLKLTILECLLNGDKKIAGAEEAHRVYSIIRFFIAQALTVMGLIQKTDRAKHEEKVLEYLKKKQRATNTDLYRLFSNNIHASDLNRTMRTLIDAHLVRKVGEGRNVYFELIVPIRHDDEELSANVP